MRRYGKIKLSVWSDPDWRDVSHTAQWLYWALVGNERLSACGTLEWRPKLFAALSPTVNVDGVESALDELREKKYVVLDEETDELVLRSFVRNDDVVSNRNMMVAVIKDWRCIVSLRIRGVVVHELMRLKTEHPQYPIWEHPDMLDALKTHPINVLDPDDVDATFARITEAGWATSDDKF